MEAMIINNFKIEQQAGPKLTITIYSVLRLFTGLAIARSF
jgi:hypothetical protein